MGNTNLPQSGAAGTDNSRDTQSGDEQLSDAEQRKRDDNRKSGDIGPAPSRPKNAPPRIPGQHTNTDGTGGAATDTGNKGGQSSRPADETLAPDDPYNPRNTTGAGDPPAQHSHIHTGYSAPDAT